MSEPRGERRRTKRWSDALAWAALVLILGGALGRASVAADPMPYWDADPLLTPSVRTGLGPSVRTLLDALAMLGAACALGSATLAGRGIQARWVALLGVGGVWVALHGFVTPTDPMGTGRGDLEDLLIGGRWLGALGGAIGLAHLRGRVRRLGLGVCLGFVVMLAAKGMMQQNVEHPLTMLDYEAQREQILAARGWRVDSPQALAYERRLRQNDASGWFGMPNVYATFGGIGLVAGTCLAIGGVRRKQTGAALAAGLGAVCGGAMLVMSHSKGGAGASAIGLGIGMLVGSGWAGNRWRAWLLAGAPAVVLLLVVARGLVGERIGELSLLFRWHYAQGSARMILEHPLLGVGPGGFRDAYLLTRPPIGVEEVASPHNVLLEWVATLGLGGLAWCGAGLGLILRAGRDGPIEEAPTNEREDVLLVAFLAGGVTVASALIEQAMATPEGALARILGLGLWVGVAWGVMRSARGSSGWTRGALAGVGGVVAAHSMIEVTPVWSNSAALLGATLGLCAGGSGEKGARGWRSGACVGALLLGGALLVAGLGRLTRWEGALARAHERVMPSAMIRDRLARLGAGAGREGDSIEMIAQDLAMRVGERVAADPATLDAQLRRATARGGEEAFGLLEEGVAARPDHPPTTEALVRLAMAMAELSGEEERAAWRERGVRASEALAERRPSSPGVWAGLGLARWGAWQGTGDRAELEASREAWARAFVLDPLSLSIAVRMVDLCEALGDEEGRRVWAREALRLDELKRLDPIKRLSDRERARMRRLADE